MTTNTIDVIRIFFNLSIVLGFNYSFMQNLTTFMSINISTIYISNFISYNIFKPAQKALFQ